MLYSLYFLKKTSGDELQKLTELDSHWFQKTLEGFIKEGSIITLDTPKGIVYSLSQEAKETLKKRQEYQKNLQ